MERFRVEVKRSGCRAGEHGETWTNWWVVEATGDGLGPDIEESNRLPTVFAANRILEFLDAWGHYSHPGGPYSRNGRVRWWKWAASGAGLYLVTQVCGLDV